jgi:hypothetical protein
VTLIGNLVRAVLGALASGVLPGYFWAGFVRRSDGLAERLAYSAALSMALVPAIALFLAHVLGTGITLLVALASIGVVVGSGALACRLKGPAAEPAGPALPRPPGIRDSRVLVLVLVALALALAWRLGLPMPGWLLITILVTLAVAGLLSYRGAEPDGERGPVIRRAIRAPAIAAVLALTALLAYAGVVRHDWPYLRGEDQFSHAVMTEQMLAHGSYSTYLVYPPGFSTLSAVICRLTDLQPLSLFPVLAPALLVLTTIGAYALAASLWGWEYGLAAAVLSGLVLVGPYVSFAGGLYPDLLSAFFLMVMLVAALVTLYQSPSVRTGLLVAVVGASVVLYHSVATLYLALVLAAVALVCLPYLLLRGGKESRRLARAIVLALAALGALSVVYASYIYDLGGFFSTGTTRATVVLDLGSQPVLRAGDLFAWVGPPVIWLGVLGFTALAITIRRLKQPAQVLAALTVLLWCVLMYLGSRTTVDGFPQRFERDVGAPLTVLAALGLGLIVQSLAGLRAGGRSMAVLSVGAAAAVAVLAAVQFAGNLVTDGKPSREVLTRQEAAAGAWLRQHNTGGTIISTPDLHRGITNRAVLAMGGYTGLQSYPLPRILHPRSLPTAGRGPLLDSREVLFHPATCRAVGIIAKDRVRFIFLYRLGTEANYAGFRTDPARYQRVFENSQIVIYAPQQASARGCSD